MKFVRVSDVKPESIRWLWTNRIARGKLTLVIGDPGLGKSYMGLDMTSRVSTGSKWPDGTDSERGNVLVLSAEDGVADTGSRRDGSDAGPPRAAAAGVAAAEAEDSRQLRRAAWRYAGAVTAAVIAAVAFIYGS